MRIWEIVDYAARFYGDQEAIICGTERLLYAQFHERVRRLAAGLLATGAAPGDRLGVLMPTCHRYAELHFAAAYTGLVLTPLDYRLTAPELAYLLNDAGVSTLVLGADQADLFAATAPSLYTGPRLIWAGDCDRAGLLYEDLLASHAPLHRPAVEHGEDELAQLYYTSGTTGRPKGAMLSERNVTQTALLNAVMTGLAADDVFLRCCAGFHMSDSWANYAVTIAGARHIILPAFEPEAVLSAVQRERVTMTSLVPTMIKALLDSPRLEDFDVSSLRLVTYGAAPIPAEHLRAALQHFPCEFRQWYGLSEAYPAAIQLLGSEVRLEGPPDAMRRLRACGRASLGMQVRVVNGAGEDVQPNEVGEIRIKGPNVMLGYWNQPEATAQALRDGWLCSGDAATVDEAGYIYIVDRLKDMMISGGENVYSTEVEQALSSHPAVRECAVIGVPDEQLGERVHAIVALRPGQSATAEELIEFTHGRIADYKCPRSVQFVAMLPKTGSGKIQKTALRAPFWAGRERQI